MDTFLAGLSPWQTNGLVLLACLGLFFVLAIVLTIVRGKRFRLQLRLGPVEMSADGQRSTTEAALDGPTVSAIEGARREGLPDQGGTTGR